MGSAGLQVAFFGDKQWGDMHLRRIALVVPAVLSILVCLSSCGRVSPTKTSLDVTPCAGYRWPVKIGIDRGAKTMNLTPQMTTIAALDGIALTHLPLDSRSIPAETTVYELQNVILLETDTQPDLDYHLIVRDKTGKRITLESPNPSCPGRSAFAKQIAAVRHTLDTLKPPVGTVLNVTGVGFYDALGSGGMELHPLLSICVGRNCRPDSATNGGRASPANAHS